MKIISKNPFIKWLKRTIIVFFVLAMLYGIGRLIVLQVDKIYSGRREPYIQLVSSNQATIRWQTIKPEQSTMKIGISLDNLNIVYQENEKHTEHDITIKQLQANTRYFYSIESSGKNNIGGKEYWFTTAPELGLSNNSRFVVIGDSGRPGPDVVKTKKALVQWAKTHPRPNKADLDFMLTLGDNAYKSGSNKQYQAAFFDVFQSLLKNIPVWPGYGNHDDRRDVFFDIFNLPTKGEAGGIPSGTEHYYSFEFANIHLISLDTTASDISPQGEMLQWLKNDLSNNKMPWIIAFFHHPPYSKGHHDSDDPDDSDGIMMDVRQHMIPILEYYGVDLVLAGHSHVYERSFLLNNHYGLSSTLTSDMVLNPSKGNKESGPYTKPAIISTPNKGTVYVVAGSTSTLDPRNLNHPAMCESRIEIGGLIIDVFNDTLTARFITKDSIISDEFSIKKINPEIKQ